jgi:hypothetical protein
MATPFAMNNMPLSMAASPPHRTTFKDVIERYVLLSPHDDPFGG